jgi:hypothetical protein
MPGPKRGAVGNVVFPGNEIDDLLVVWEGWAHGYPWVRSLNREQYAPPDPTGWFVWHSDDVNWIPETEG